MKNKQRIILDQEIDKQIETAKTILSATNPGQDIELMIMNRLLKKRGAEIRNTEVDSFKKHAISTLGTENEINFNDAEIGFLKASLADGRAGFKEFIETIPVKTPECDDGTQMENKGNEKKTL